MRPRLQRENSGFRTLEENRQHEEVMRSNAALLEQNQRAVQRYSR